MTNQNIHEAARLVAQARQLLDQYAGKSIPGDVGREIERLLEQSKEASVRGKLEEREAYLGEPQYKHDMTGGLATKATAGGYGIGGSGPLLSAETKQFLTYVRTGAPQAKASLVEDTAGLNLIPDDFVGTIIQEMARVGVMRRLAFIRRTTKPKVDVGAIAIGTPTWGVLETGATAPDGLGAASKAATIVVHDLSALCLLGRDELEDSDEDLAGIVSRALAATFAQTEDDAFFGGTGDGDDMPWAASHTVTQNVTAAASATPTPDDMKSLTFAVPAWARVNGVFVVHSKVEQAISLWKNNNGDFLLQPSSAQGEPPTLHGYKVFTSDGLDDPSTAGVADVSCLFGDFNSGYLICDRRQFSVHRLTERYAELGKVGLLCTMRVGGDVVRPKALAKYLL